MSWTEFLQILGLLYGVYYAILIAIDHLRQGAYKSNTEQPLVLSFVEQPPQDVSVIASPVEPVISTPPQTPPSAARSWEDDLPLLDPLEDEDNEEDEDENDPDQQESHGGDTAEDNPGEAVLSLASGITDFTGALSLEGLLEQIEEQKVEIVQKLYAKYAPHEKLQVPTASSAT
ncbi:hypothetical protein HP439_04590 [Sphingobacterium shayense]|uniref:hypothetical protein n=1 Tax=Sphingobacterium shayense TaxID=626343 RepID=UPI001556066F|nr:hypothetical protein [Sphingobacterium shayense]NQD69999.1 hypothetical protein [Sphingobacterium shayense]